MFGDGVDLDLGGARAQVRHVGGDHADDSTVMFVEPDGLLFLGDCLCEATGGYTRERFEQVVQVVRGFGAQLFVEGDSDEVFTASGLDEFIAEARSGAT